ncbi:MAG TPA: hypothetical protein VNG90_00725 [Candidatus Acidoferrum sp.]|nr:hypothetical protein [Candidatus Acidoferrum sp.]
MNWKVLPQFRHSDFQESVEIPLTFVTVMRTVGEYQRNALLLRLSQREGYPARLALKAELLPKMYRLRTRINFLPTHRESWGALYVDGYLFAVQCTGRKVSWQVGRAIINDTPSEWPFEKDNKAPSVKDYFMSYDVGVEILRQPRELTLSLKIGPSTGDAFFHDGPYGWLEIARITRTSSSRELGWWAFGSPPPIVTELPERYRYDLEGPFVEFRDLEFAVPAE